MAWFLPALSSVGEAAGTVGSALGSAAGAVGTGLADVGSTLSSLFPGATGAESAAGSLAQGIGALGAPSEAGYLASLGQAVPAGVELLGPSATFTGPGFWGSFAQGFLGQAVPQLASPSAATSIGSGVGGLLNVLSQLPQASPGGGMGGGMPALPIGGGQIVRLADRAVRGIEQAPGAPLPFTQGPIMKLIGGLFQGF